MSNPIDASDKKSLNHASVFPVARGDTVLGYLPIRYYACRNSVIRLEDLIPSP